MKRKPQKQPSPPLDNLEVWRFMKEIQQYKPRVNQSWIADKLCVSQAAISQALRNQNPGLLVRINNLLTRIQLSNRRAA